MMGKRKLTYEDFKKYFFNRQQPDEKHQFEKEMMQDAFEEEAFDGLSMLSEEELENDIQSLKNKINQRTQKRKRLIPLYFRYAAGIAILIGIGLSTFYILNNSLEDKITFTEPMHESMALSEEQKPDEEKIALEQEREEVTSEKSHKSVETIDTKKAETPKPKEPAKTIDDLVVEDNEADEMDIDSEFEGAEMVTEFIMEEEAEEEEPFMVIANEEVKQETEKTTEMLATGGVTDKSIEEKSGKGNEKNRSLKERKLFGNSRAKKSAATTASESLADEATPQAQSVPVLQDREVAPPNNWVIDTLENKLISDIKKRFDLANEIYKIDMELTINGNGQITQIKHNREIPDSLQSIIQNILNEFGLWQFAIENGQAVEKKVRIRFKLKP
jgi:uncharacterized small protein (DUF1192 family)